MNFENLQKAWKEQDMSTRPIDTELLLQEIRRSRRLFASAILQRDALEVIVAVLLAGFFISLGMHQHSWTHFAGAAILLGVAGFMLGDRWVQRLKRPRPGDSLKDCVDASLHEVEHQIWLLRNILWWYLLPITAGVFTVFGATLIQMDPLAAGWRLMLLALAYGGVYWLNQRTVRTDLEPRRRELTHLRSSIET